MDGPHTPCLGFGCKAQLGNPADGCVHCISGKRSVRRHLHAPTSWLCAAAKACAEKGRPQACVEASPFSIRIETITLRMVHTLRQYLESLSFCLSRLDGGFFILTNLKLDARILLSIHVDDILLIGTHTLIPQLKEEMKECLEMHDLGEALLYLGMSIEGEQEKRSILLSQSHYVQTVLERFKMHEANPVSTPMDPKIRLVKAQTTMNHATRPSTRACSVASYIW